MATPSTGIPNRRQSTHHQPRLRLTPYSTTRVRSRKSILGVPYTPQIFRLLPSTQKFGTDQNGHDVSFEDILKKQWKVYSLSPLYNFKTKPVLFKKYSRSLDAAFSQSQNAHIGEDKTGSMESKFSVHPGLSAHEKDPEAIKIEIVEKLNGTHRKSALSALMMCVDNDFTNHPVKPEHLEHFTYYPVLLINGNKKRTDTFITWLEMHFDCHVSPLTFNNNNLRVMLAMWSHDVSSKSPVLMQYSLKSLSEDIGEDIGISTIDCTFDSSFCKSFWERLNPKISTAECMDSTQVNTFLEGLETDLQYRMSICFSKLNLSEVGTPLAYVSSTGKLKLLSYSGVFKVLCIICKISKDRFCSIDS